MINIFKTRKLFENEIKSRIEELKKIVPHDNRRDIEIISRMIYNRLDESMLIYSRLYGMTFYEVCDKFGIDYDGFVGLVTNKRRTYLLYKKWLGR